MFFRHIIQINLKNIPTLVGSNQYINLSVFPIQDSYLVALCFAKFIFSPQKMTLLFLFVV